MGMPASAARGKRGAVARSVRAAGSAASLVVAGLCAGWVLSFAAHRGVLDASSAELRVSARPAPAPPRGAYGALVDTLFAQGLSHVAFHAEYTKRALVNMVEGGKGSRTEVAVVGVEWGAEVQMFAEHGYTVHAFEPVKMFHDDMQAKIARNKQLADEGKERRWDVRLHKIAAGKEGSGSMNLTYHTEANWVTETVRRGKMDDYVHGELAVLSVDIQGNELDVLKGATRLLSNGVGVRSLWVEIFPCNRKVLGVLKMLDKDYVIFDFVPWGRAMEDGKPAKQTVSLAEHESFLAEDGGTRPADFERYFDWFCKKRRSFQWLQSDVLAVRRDLVTPELMVKLGTLGNDLFVGMWRREKGRTLMA